MGKLKDEELKEYVKAGTPIAGKSDGGGLTFTLSRGRTASWVLRYRHGGKPREITIGNYPDITLKAARIAARAARAKIDAGVDVAGEKRKAVAGSAEAKTFRQVGEEYLARVRLAPKTRKEYRRYLDKDLFPKLGHIPARDVSSQDIVSRVEKIGERSYSVARCSFDMLSSVFAFAMARHAVLVNPCAGLQVSAILGERPPTRERLKLSRDELVSLLASAPKLGRANELMLKILLATCTRKGELVRAKKAHLDFDAGLWTVPNENAKEGKGYTIPLAPAVVDWFGELVAVSGDSSWVLPARNGRGRFNGRHVSDKTINKALERAEFGIRAFTPHDLRSTARSHLTAKPPHGLGVDVIVAERCLNHSLGGLVAVYDKHDYLDERRWALEKWANFLTELETGKPSNVLPLRAAA